MVIDTSALVAILQDEPERRAFNELIEAATERWLSTASFVELSIAIETRRGADRCQVRQPWDFSEALGFLGLEYVKGGYRKGTTKVDVADRDQRALCESDFEREVFDELAKCGYRVLAQVRAGGFRIDLVVAGADDRRLAIECDGDRYHGMDRWMQDMSRQRVLERMGWRFWRCWASSWITQREACLADLLETLANLGIDPWGHEGDRRHSLLVEYRTIDADGVEPRRRMDEGHPVDANEADPIGVIAGVAAKSVEDSVTTSPAKDIRQVANSRARVALSADQDQHGSPAGTIRPISTCCGMRSAS